MDEQQKKAFEQALERKHEANERKAVAGRTGLAPGADPGQTDPEGQFQSIDGIGRQQDDHDARAKNTGHKKKTADKWNQ